MLSLETYLITSAIVFVLGLFTILYKKMLSVF